jgi:hypothetical protein
MEVHPRRAERDELQQLKQDLNGAHQITQEFEAVYRRYVHESIPLTYSHRLPRYPLERVRHRHHGVLFAHLIYFNYQCAIIALLSPFYASRRAQWMNWAYDLLSFVSWFMINKHYHYQISQRRHTALP